ncbi:38979_t:CDS:2 [Gigaspora margarita]|uniref:38979_t:CDS:1 n=1 Tax=Gigaspora margarita TaxID=4874 RepID=A0ABN7V7I0_GIGMA|nr:38979_t:CDS:2 [Gigaspora margarita]
MRLTQATNPKAKEFSEYLLKIENSTEPTIGNNLIRLPDKIVISAQNEQQIVERFPGEQYMYFSFDSVPEDTLNLYPIEFLNILTPQELLSYILALKINVPIMLLRNLDPVNGLCNGTRLICYTLEDSELPFILERKQFPIYLAFALTINKFQDQTFSHIGLYFSQPVFSHEKDSGYTQNVVFREALNY